MPAAPTLVSAKPAGFLAKTIPMVAIAHVPAPPALPSELRSTDALQNLTEALLAVQLLPPGVYVAMHNQVLAFPGVVKDRQAGTFTKL